MTKYTAEQLIDILGLIPLPAEGGLFKQTYLSTESIPLSSLPKRYTVDKPMGTAIFYLFTDDKDSFSSMHVLPTDEIFHFYFGDPVEQLNLYPDGSSKKVILGQDLLDGQHIQYVASAGVWQGSRLVPSGKIALIGTTMAPGFTVEDYVGGECQALIEEYPQEEEMIRALTRIDGDLVMKL